jgi:XTP/dITP diphosphohydrolase
VNPPPRRIVLASGNAGKLREFAALLAPLGLSLSPQSEFGVPAAEEPFATFLENALAKARHASRLTGLPALADDSGICVPALGGRPGVWSARWAALRREQGAAPAAAVDGSDGFDDDPDTRNNAQLIADLAALRAGPDGAGSAPGSAAADRPGIRPERRAHYYCVLVLVRAADDPQPIVADGSWHGEVIDTPRGSGGFGYDPHFLIPALGRTVAELDADTKNRLSHRGQAMRALVARLREDGLTA